MSRKRSFSAPAALAAIVISTIVIACGDRRASNDTLRVASQTPAPETPKTPEGIPAAVRGVCDDIASGWRAISNITLRVNTDTLMNVWGGADTNPVRGCSVIAEDSVAFAKADSARIKQDGVAKLPYWRNAERAGWTRLLHVQADGPGATSTGYQRGLVRCAVSETWDAEDDSDSTYVPKPWYREETSCWWHGRPLVVHDTSNG